ncbi:MAG: FAD-dependent monooxygenase, partial [Burkholderiaceae bacterium]
MNKADVLVRGTGIVGTSLALALARGGLRVVLRDTAPQSQARDDVRAFALNAASVALLSELRVWDSLPVSARTAVHEMQVHGDAAGSSIEFSAWQQRVGELAWITDAALLERELATAVRFAPHITRVDEDVAAPLTALCEGRDSQTRERLGVPLRRVDYRQSAIAARLVSDRAHAGVARQWFTSDGVLALLPFDSPRDGHSYALVWSLANLRADEIMALDAAAFEHALASATGGVAGS